MTISKHFRDNVMLTPKQQAKALITSFYLNVGSFENKRQCALICVNKILETLSNQIIQVDAIDIVYWLEVKQELKKLKDEQ